MSLEEQSFKNLVHFYRDELRQVVNGAKASDFFMLSQRRSLVLWGVLTRRTCNVSPEARALLEEASE